VNKPAAHINKFSGRLVQDSRAVALILFEADARRADRKGNKQNNPQPPNPTTLSLTSVFGCGVRLDWLLLCHISRADE
jgi:hypothetical protein